MQKWAKKTFNCGINSGLTGEIQISSRARNDNQQNSFRSQLDNTTNQWKLSQSSSSENDEEIQTPVIKMNSTTGLFNKHDESFSSASSSTQKEKKEPTIVQRRTGPNATIELSNAKDGISSGT